MPKSSKPSKEESPRTRLLSRANAYKIASVLVLIGLAWLIYLDAKVIHKFDGKRWSLPAQVYARSLEIYNDLPLNLTNLQHELKLLDYQRVIRVESAGQYRLSGDQVEVKTRAHDSPEGLQESAHFRFRLRGDVVRNLESLDGSSLGIYSVDPLKIGGVYPRTKEERILLPYEDFPEALLATLLVVEDRNFKDHIGISFSAIARAMVANVKAGRIVQGGSTLTQQLVKNFFLTRERSLTRKVNEAMMALLLELHYDKQLILETYLNDIFLGQSGSIAIHGFEAASWYYFGRPIATLDWSHYALMVAIIKGPSYYNPRRYPERAKKRRDLVLKVLLDEGVIEAQEYHHALAQGLDLVDKPKYKADRYPAFMDLVKRQLRESYSDEDLSSEGLNIYTTLDPQLQYQLETAAKARMSLLDSVAVNKGASNEASKKLQMAAVVTDTGTGEILALMGDRNASFKGFNRALDAHRPIGSLIKPAVYLSALEQPSEYSLASPMLDQSFAIEFEDGQVWQPRNFDKEDHGTVRLIEALSKSYNLSSARLGLDVGIDRVHELIERLGVERDLNPYPSFFLGAQSMTPMEVTQLYQTIASNGFNIPLRAVREVTDASGQSLSRYAFEIEQVVEPQAIFLLRHALIETMKTGTGRSSYWTLPDALIVAGKTGTTNDNRDSWFSGFSQDYLATVWIGHDDNTPSQFTGSSGALKVWTDFMARLPQYPLENKTPGGIEYHWVDIASGVMTEEQCKGSAPMPFWGEPQLEYSDCEQGYSSIGGWIKSWF